MIDGWMAGQPSFEGLTLDHLHNAWFPVRRHASVNHRQAIATLLITVECCQPLSAKDRHGTLDSSSNHQREHLLRRIADRVAELDLLWKLEDASYRGPLIPKK
jgi:hypothetical protein